MAVFCVHFLLYLMAHQTTNTYTGEVFVSAGCECYSSKQYYVSSTSFTFINALAYCQSLQAALVEVETLEEHYFLDAIMMTAITNLVLPGMFWVGLEYTGVYIWKLNGSVILPDLWCPDEPNEWAAGDYCVRYRQSNGTFCLADRACSSLFNVICEKNMTSGVCECPNTTSSTVTVAAVTGMMCNASASTNAASTTTTVLAASTTTTVLAASTTTTVLTTTQGFQAPTSSDINTQQLIADMTVNEKTTGKSKRQLTSAEDKRFSAQLIGVMGICCLVIVFLLPVLMDLTTFLKHHTCHDKNGLKK